MSLVFSCLWLSANRRPAVLNRFLSAPAAQPRSSAASEPNRPFAGWSIGREAPSLSRKATAPPTRRGFSL